MTTTMTNGVANTTPKLTGQELIDYVNYAEVSTTKSKTEQCLGAGYIKEYKGETRPDFIGFYEALLDAKTEAGLMPTTDVTGADWYDNLTGTQQELYDAIEEMCPEFEKLTTDQCDEFMAELDDLGITNAEQFNDAYYGQQDGWHPEREFAEEFMVGTGAVNEDNPIFFAIDWDVVWNNSLQYDFSTIEFDGTTYFFHNNF